jgi:hypothetical protein
VETLLVKSRYSGPVFWPVILARLVRRRNHAGVYRAIPLREMTFLSIIIAMAVLMP